MLSWESAQSDLRGGGTGDQLYVVGFGKTILGWSLEDD